MGQASRLSCSWGAAISILTLLLFSPQRAPAQNAGSLQYQFQPNQTLRYRLDLQHEVKMSGSVGQDLPVVTKITFQASVRMVEVDSVGITTFEARAEGFSARTTIGSKETVSPASAAGQTVKVRVGPFGLMPGHEVSSGSSGLPWNLFLSQVFPDLTRCWYLGPAVFNGKPCAKIGFEINQGKGSGLFAEGHLISGETQGSVDLGYSAKGAFSSRLSLLP